jgi:signal transduction histidine kinase
MLLFEELKPRKLISAGEATLPKRDTPSPKKSEFNPDGENAIRLDAEKRSAAEISARASQRLSVLGEMTGGIAHDFRNILTVIESGLRLAEKNSDEPQKVRTFIAGARQGVARGLELTSQLLTFAKQGGLQPCAADANALLKNLELFLKYGAGPNVCVDLHLSPSIPNCVVDPSQFNVAILNLVINARDAMPNGGKIQLSTTRCLVGADAFGSTPGVYVRVRVQDNGSGMTKQVVQKIFEPFFTTKGEKGTGLGIPQVGAFMRHVGGHVAVTSELGLETTFDLFFPTVGPETYLPDADKMNLSFRRLPADESSTQIEM